MCIRDRNQGGLFGQQGSTQPAANSGGLFGGNTSTPSNQTFMGGQQQTQGNGLFGGGGQQTQGNGLFGGQQQQQQQPQQQQGGLFGNKTTSPYQAQGSSGTPQSSGGLFSSFATSTPQNNSPLLGNQTTNAQNNNKLGGTSWGVPTTTAQPTAGQTFQPVRSKNSKLDQKHLVKCISALEQFQGSNKEELRIFSVSYTHLTLPTIYSV